MVVVSSKSMLLFLTTVGSKTRKKCRNDVKKNQSDENLSSGGNLSETNRYFDV